MPIAVTDSQLAMAASASHWASRSGSIAAVRSLEATSGRLGAQSAGEHWLALAELGVFGIAVPEVAGGAGGTAADLAAVVEQLAAWLVPGPVLPTLLAGLLLADLADPGPALADLLAGLSAGGISMAVALSASTVSASTVSASTVSAGTVSASTVSAGTVSASAVALSASTMSAARQSDGSLRVTGRSGLVLGAGDTSHLLLGARTDSGESWFVLGTSDPGVAISPRTPVDFSRALADVSLDDVRVTPDLQLPGLCTERVRDAAATLAVAEAAGVAAWCSRTAAEYAATRRQFGRPIGSFQAVKHLCAGMLCRSELATAAAWDAAQSAGQPSHPLAAAAAAALALDAAVDNAKDCVQVLGGIGFTWEHDAHLYLRRALALRQLLGGSARWRARAAELALAGMRRDSDSRFGINETSGASAVRSAARLAAEQIAALPPADRRMALAQSGYAAPHWPAPYGRSADPAARLVIDEELASAGLSQPDLLIGGWAVPAILAYGTPAQQDRFAGPTLRGEITWCQLFSEPEAGSDLASLRTRAVRADGGWLLSGQKVWTSLARQADWAICLARTDPAAAKHKGISFFLVIMNSPGIDIRPLRELTGREMFNEVFLDDVFVPDDCLVGEPGDGWRIARATLATERVAMGSGSELSAEVRELLAAADAIGGQDATTRDSIGARLAEGLALAAMDDRLASAVLSGADPGFQAAVRKLLGVGHRQALAETALTLQGTDGAAADGAGAEAVHQFLLTRCLSIAGGTSQILLSLVAERILRLPREEAR